MLADRGPQPAPLEAQSEVDRSSRRSSLVKCGGASWSRDPAAKLPIPLPLPREPHGDRERKADAYSHADIVHRRADRDPEHDAEEDGNAVLLLHGAIIAAECVGPMACSVGSTELAGSLVFP